MSESESALPHNVWDHIKNKIIAMQIQVSEKRCLNILSALEDIHEAL
jgi:hypothetical protein